jgi:short-subunit dehydrogenase
MKRIIIIGASSGIGKELAMLYAAEGNMVGITGRRDQLLSEIRKEYPSRIFTACFSVTDANCQTAVENLIAEMGGLDILVYNAGFGEPSEKLNSEIEIATTETNVLGFVRLVSFAFQFFVRQGNGQIALTSSVAALRGNSWTPSYSASKAFMSNFAEGLSLKAKKVKKDIAVTDIKPGFIKTKMAKGNGQFWVASPEKAARQMKLAIDKRRRVVYITRRWWLIAQIFRLLPFSVYKRIA